MKREDNRENVSKIKFRVDKSESETLKEMS
jgi:hypothetical protein